MDFKYERSPTPGENFRKSVEFKRVNSQNGFGCRTERFDFEELTPTPGVGKYQVTDRSLELRSPSLSRKGYRVNTAPKLPVFAASDVPGPCAYSPKMTSIGDVDTSRPTTAFIPSGMGRVPFSPPNKVPGPNSYEINPEPGVSPLLKKKKSYYFESTERRSKFLDTNDIPPPLSYHNAFPALPSPKHDVEWSKSSFKRFSELGKDNFVPGPDRYFQEHREEEYFPRKTLRTAGNYRGRYIGKLQAQPKRPPTTFGADKDRQKGRFLGRLDLKAQIPGPGQYFEHLHSSFSPPVSPRRSISPPGMRSPTGPGLSVLSTSKSNKILIPFFYVITILSQPFLQVLIYHHKRAMLSQDLEIFMLIMCKCLCAQLLGRDFFPSFMSHGLCLRLCLCLWCMYVYVCAEMCYFELDLFVYTCIC